MEKKNGKFDYEKRIADYRASTDPKALEWRTAVLRMDEKDQKRAYFRFTVAGGRDGGDRRNWQLAQFVKSIALTCR